MRAIILSALFFVQQICSSNSQYWHNLPTVQENQYYSSYKSDYAKYNEFPQDWNWAAYTKLETNNDEVGMVFSSSTINPDIVEDSFLLTPNLARKYGYPSEIHSVVTSDGYVLEMHRISGSPQSPPCPGKTVVFLQHGLFDSSATWILMGTNQGLGYLLADLGYDVWLGNARGNRYSRQHIDFDPDGEYEDRQRFWSFSWNEIGMIDLPTMIDYVTQATGQVRMHYVGHSQGTTSFFVMCSELPEYNSRIISAHMLAPIAFSGNIRSPFVQAGATVWDSLSAAFNTLGIFEFLPHNDLLSLLGQKVCLDDVWSQDICSNVIFLVGGFDADQLNSTMLPIVLGHTPAGAATAQVVHYGQIIRSNRFCKFDFGWFRNLEEYGTITPPDYSLSNINAPIILYYSSNDLLSEPVDVEELWSKISNPIYKILIDNPDFNHNDYVWAIDGRSLVYNHIVNIMREFE